MGKNDVFSAKEVSKRIKAKGLLKLKYYCQMCRKHCRDENGFKCHCLSESHQRQMEVFGQNPDGVIESFTEEFQTAFLEHVKRSHRFSRVAATVVYNDFITDRHHVHMNSTKWATLTDFVKHLGRTGKCKVEETIKGWFITYVDQYSEMFFGDKRKRTRADLVDDEWEIRTQIERASEQIRTKDGVEVHMEQQHKVLKTEKSDDIKVKIKLRKNFVNKKNGDSLRLMILEEDEILSKNKKLKKDKSSGCKSALDELMREQEEAKEWSNRHDYWLCQGIVVKLMCKPLADNGYYKQKGVVQKVIDKYVGEIEMIETKHVLRVDQQELETVIPQIGALVKIVNGAYRGSIARLLAVDTTNFSAKVQIEKGLYDGRVLPAIEYEDICKLCSDTTI
ncbi:DNA/RNA-binding protein Kin17, conserved region [Heracleum sosnowskyi]|uniref:KIN17-like protein n=1 Tax=Heracleum sosnowskyi TaxID=360622 RepID=A0AAD8N5E8_9APIA|nr:DNA/RNA-binding protein Kin17, conserved region [Heracleum sosnowskyi]